MESKELECVIQEKLDALEKNGKFTVGDTYTLGCFGSVDLSHGRWKQVYIDIKLYCEDDKGECGTLWDEGVADALSITPEMLKWLRK